MGRNLASAAKADDKVRWATTKKKEVSLIDRMASYAMSSADVDWADVDQDALMSCIANVTRIGGMITCSISRDGGALVLGLFHNSDKHQLYARSPVDMLEHIDAVTRLAIEMRTDNK
jgi:hypothetical protein